MIAVLIALLLWATTATPGISRLRLDYQPFDVSTPLLILRFLTPAAWFIALTSLLCVKGKRLVSTR